MSQVDRHWNLCVLSIIRSRYYFYPSHLQSNIQDVMQLAQLVFIYNQLGGQLSLAGWHTQLNILCWHWYVLIEYVRILQALAWLILNSQVQWRKREFQEERLSTVVQNFQIYWCGLLIHTMGWLVVGLINSSCPIMAFVQLFQSQKSFNTSEQVSQLLWTVAMMWNFILLSTKAKLSERTKNMKTNVWMVIYWESVSNPGWWFTGD